MGIITREVNFNCQGGATERYENLGYYIPREIDAQGRLRIANGTIIKVKVEDLPAGSNYKIEVVCDICGEIRTLSYTKCMKNIARNAGLYICSNARKHNEISNDEDCKNFIKSIKQYLKQNGRFPKYNDFTIENGLPSYKKARDFAKSKGKQLSEFLNDIDCKKTARPSERYYDIYVEQYKKLMIKSKIYGIYEIWKKFKNKGLPTAVWMIKHAPKEANVTDAKSWFKYAGLLLPDMSKEDASRLILERAKAINQPLKYDDFRGHKIDFPNIHTIRRHWGTLNKMKEELGLEIIQESMIDKDFTIEKIDEEIKSIADKLINGEHRKDITMADLKIYGASFSSAALRKYVKLAYNCTNTEYFAKFGLSLIEAGRGLVYHFQDGEITTSVYEKLFSEYLRNCGLVYGNHYRRDVKYSSFIPGYKGQTNCDYVINLNDREIYIEIAGVLKEYKQWYCANREITASKSKEKYRKKLYEKEKMLSQHVDEYFILFPCDLALDFFSDILHDDYKTTFEKIRRFNKNNLDFKAAQKMGGLIFDRSVIGRDRQAKQIV